MTDSIPKHQPLQTEILKNSSSSLKYRRMEINRSTAFKVWQYVFQLHVCVCVCMRYLYFNLFLWETACSIYVPLIPTQWFCCSIQKHQSFKMFLFHILIFWEQLPLLVHELLTATDNLKAKTLPSGDTRKHGLGHRKTRLWDIVGAMSFCSGNSSTALGR